MHQCTCGCASHNVDQITPEFRRSVSNIIIEKFDGDAFAYIKSLYETIDMLNTCMENNAVDFLSEARAA